MATIYPPTERLGLFEAHVTNGVLGGIPSLTAPLVDATAYGFSASASGADNTAAIVAALSASSSGGGVSLPEGTFNYSGLPLNYQKGNRRVVGAGSGKTTLKLIAGAETLFKFAEGITANWSQTTYNGYSKVTSGIERGSYSVVVEDASVFITNTIVRLELKNEIETPVVSLFDYCRVITLLLVSKSGNTLTFATPIPQAFTDSLAAGSAYVKGSQQLAWHASKQGIEGITFDGHDAAEAGTLNDFASEIRCCSDCWVKDVVIKNHKNYGIYIFDCTQIELQKVEVLAGYEASGGTNHAGILFNGASNSLVWDCILQDNFPELEVNFGACNNIFAFNVFKGACNVNHGPHNHLNLFEGNTYISYLQSDGYFGGQSEHVYFREFYRGGNIGSRKRFCRNDVIYGGSVGTPTTTETTDYSEKDGLPNIGNEDSHGVSSLTGVSGASPWPDWDSTKLSGIRRWTGTVTSRPDPQHLTIQLATGTGDDFVARIESDGASVGVSWGVRMIDGNQVAVDTRVGDVITVHSLSTVAVLPDLGPVEILAGPPTGFQQKDLDVNATVWRKQVYTVYSESIDHPLDAGDAMPDSLFCGAKPAFFGTKNWPPISPVEYTDSDAPTPALHRYLNAGDMSYLGETPAPTAPSGLTATAISSSRINLAWTDNSNNELGFDILSGASAGSLTLLATVGPGVTTYSALSFTPETTYYFAVRSYNSGGNSANSNVANATTNAAPAPSIPTAPSGMTATVNSSTEIGLSWTDNSNDETGFRVYQGTNLIATKTAGVTTHVVSGLTPATEYTFSVSAYNSAGESTTSTDSATTGPAAPTVPTAPSGVTATTVSDTVISVSWTDNSDNETGFRVYQGASLIATTSAGVTTHVVSGLTPETEYTFSVSAYNAAGESTHAVEDSATTDAAPVDPPVDPPIDPPVIPPAPLPASVSTVPCSMTLAVQQVWRRLRGIARNAAFAATVTPVPNQADIFNIGTLTGAITIANPSGAFTDGQLMTLRIAQDTVGGRVITWGNGYAFSGDVTAAGLPTTASAKYEVTFRYHAATGKWRAVSQARGF